MDYLFRHNNSMPKASNISDSVDTFFDNIPLAETNSQADKEHYLEVVAPSDSQKRENPDVAHLKDEAILEELLAFLELEPIELGEDFPSPLIGVHDGEEDVLSCFTLGDRDDVILYNVNIPKEKGKNTWLLQEFYANIVTGGRVTELTSSGQKGVWLSRMLADLGRINLPEVDYRRLSREHIAKRDHLKAVYDGFILLLKCHLHYEDCKPALLNP